MFTRKGVLVTCDVPMKQLIQHLDPNKKVVLHDLDATHLFIDGNYVREVQGEIEAFNDRHVYAPLEEADKKEQEQSQKRQRQQRRQQKKQQQQQQQQQEDGK